MTRIVRGMWKRAVLICIGLGVSSSLIAQQKGQYQPGKYGLKAGVLPDPGITYADFNLNYSAGRLNFVAAHVDHTELIVFSADVTCDVGNDFGSPLTCDYAVDKKFTGEVIGARST
jgi:hypothetical protein